MTATVIDLTERMDRAAARSRRTLRALRDYRGLRTDQALADCVGMSRSKVNDLATGRSKLTVEAIAAFAAALDVPDYVLAMDADDALHWVMNPSPNGPTDDNTTGDLGILTSRQKANRNAVATVVPLRSARAA